MTPVLAMIGSNDIMIIAVVVVLLFGTAKIPQLMKGMGEGIREFKKAAADESAEAKSTDDKKGQDK